MKVEFWQIGKTSFPWIQEGAVLYSNRIERYVPFQVVTLPDIRNARNLSPDQLKNKEAELILHKIRSEDYLLLLDEKGEIFSSTAFAGFLEKKLMQPHRRLVFLVGGAFGFAPEMYQRANAKISLSAMTFSHQLVRVLFLEQLYRAFTILKNEPYHNS